MHPMIYENYSEPTSDGIRSLIDHIFEIINRKCDDFSKSKNYKIRGANRIIQHLLRCRYTAEWLEKLIFLFILLLACFIQANKKPKHFFKRTNPNNEPTFLVARLSSPLFNEPKETLCLTPSTANTLQASVNLRKVQWML